MFTDNTVHIINKNNRAEMDRKGSKAYRIPLQVPVVACTRYRRRIYHCPFITK